MSRNRERFAAKSSATPLDSSTPSPHRDRLLKARHLPPPRRIGRRHLGELLLRPYVGREGDEDGAAARLERAGEVGHNIIANVN